MVDFITKEIGGRVTQTSGEECDWALLVWCDVIYAQLEIASHFPHKTIPLLLDSFKDT